MNILLVCANGMSTSLIVNKMKESAEQQGESHVIVARPIDQFEALYADYDVVLLGPQVKYKRNEFAKIAEKDNVPTGVIDSMDYGLGRGDAILAFAKSLVEGVG